MHHLALHFSKSPVHNQSLAHLAILFAFPKNPVINSSSIPLSLSKFTWLLTFLLFSAKLKNQKHHHTTEPLTSHPFSVILRSHQTPSQITPCHLHLSCPKQRNPAASNNHYTQQQGLGSLTLQRLHPSIMVKT